MKPGPLKNTWLFIVVCFITLTANSQTAKLDSLHNLLKSAKSDTSKGRMYFNISYKWSRSSPDTALVYADTAYQLFSKANYTVGSADASLLQGRMYMTTGHFSIALQKYNEALTNYTNLSDELNIAYVYNTIGMCYSLQRKNGEALNFYLKALPIYEKHSSLSGMANTYMKIGVLQQQSLNIDRALTTYYKALKLAEQAGDKKNIGYIYIDIGEIFEIKHQYNNALDVLFKSKQLTTELGLLPTVAEADINIGNAYRELKKFDSSIYHFTLAARVFEKLKNPEKLSRLYSSIANLLIQRKQYNEAEQCIFLSNNETEKVKNYPVMFNNYQMLVKINRAKGNYKTASDYFDKILELNDSIYDAEKNFVVENLKEKYDDEKRKNLISKLQEENEEKTKQRNELAIVIIVVAALFFGLAFMAFQIKKKKRLLHQQKQKMEELNVVKDKFLSILSHDLRSPMRSTLGLLNLMATPGALSEEENKMLFQQLSLSTSSVLETLDNMLAWAKNQINQTSAVKKEVNLQNIAHRVSRFLKQTADNKTIKIINNITEPVLINGDENQLEFVIRNLVSNAVKFSHEGSCIELSAIQMKKQVNFYVKDYGTGMKKDVQLSLFDVNKRQIRKGTSGETGSGLGLALSQEFVVAHNGKLTVKSEEGQGTEFTITIPTA
jgi:signal transduction histidine kinase